MWRNEERRARKESLLLPSPALPPGGTAVQARACPSPVIRHITSHKQLLPPPHGSPSLCPLLARGHQHCIGPMTEPVILSPVILSCPQPPTHSPPLPPPAWSSLFEGLPPQCPTLHCDTLLSPLTPVLSQGEESHFQVTSSHSQGQWGQEGVPTLLLGPDTMQKHHVTFPPPEACSVCVYVHECECENGGGGNHLIPNSASVADLMGVMGGWSPAS